jgi:2-phospho-L-lactate guanylyltransferase
MLGSLRALIESACFEGIVVVSRDATALALAATEGVEALREQGEPELNLALEAARELALSRGAAGLLVLASDLPLVDAEAIRRAVAAADEAAVVVVPDRRNEGTNALLLRPADVIDFGFGGLSSQRHLGFARQAGVVARLAPIDNLGFDIDLPEDLHDLESLGWRLVDATQTV